MSNFSDAKIYGDLLHLFDQLGTALHDARTALQLPDADARQVALRGMQEVVAGYAMGFSSMIYQRSQAEIIESWGTTNLDPDEARRIIEDAWKLGMLTLFHFKLDSLFQNILRAIGVYKGRPGFATMVEEILRIAPTDQPQRTRDILLLTGHLRNSQHNNGMHRGPDLKVGFLDMDYDLKKDKAISCASWSHVLAALYVTIGVVENILASPEIKKLPAPIADAYAMNPVSL